MHTELDEEDLEWKGGIGTIRVVVPDPELPRALWQKKPHPVR